MNKQKRWEILFIIVALICTFFSITTGEFFNKKVRLEIGQIAPEDVYAPIQIENEIATERKKFIEQQKVQEVYKVDPSILQEATEVIQLLFRYCHAIVGTDIVEHYKVSAVELLKTKSPIPLYEDEYHTLVEMTQQELYELEGIILEIVDKTLKEGVQADTATGLKIRGLLENTGLTSMTQKVAYEIISSQIKPNIIVDEEVTNLQKEQVAEGVETVYVLQGEKIIGQGARITEETHLLLTKIGYLESEEHKGYMQYIGVSILLVLILLLLLRYIYITREIKNLQLKQSGLIFMLYMVSLGLIGIFEPLYFIFLPLSTAPILIAIFIHKDLAIVMHLVFVIVAAFAHKGDNIYILYLTLTGLISISLVREIQQRKGTMRSAISLGVIYSMVYIGINLAIGIPLEAALVVKVGQAFIMGVVQVILIVGSLPLWEVAFGFETPSQLLELTNPDQPILKRMLIEATGTYYHSLLVANLAEAAADEIGANPLLARVGGYYHDIGKLNCSNYFKENQVLENPHDYMEASASAKIIISHATSGVELANAYKLPQCVKDMIIQHHGTGVMQYFYIKAQKDGEEVALSDFKYPGPKPQTKEAALIMLADVVEATVRAMQGKIGVEITVEDLVRKMVKQKLEEGQLDECPLYISDIEKIIGSFSKMLKGMYHERIEYPDKKG